MGRLGSRNGYERRADLLECTASTAGKLIQKNRVAAIKGLARILCWQRISPAAAFITQAAFPARLSAILLSALCLLLLSSALAKAADSFSGASHQDRDRLFTLVEVLEDGLISEARFLEEFAMAEFGDDVFCKSSPEARFCDGARLLSVNSGGSKRFRLPKILGGPGNPATMIADIDILRVCATGEPGETRIVGISGRQNYWFAETLIEEFPHVLNEIPDNLDPRYAPERDPKSVYGPNRADGLRIRFLWPTDVQLSQTNTFGFKPENNIRHIQADRYAFVMGAEPPFSIGSPYVGRTAFLEQCLN